MDHLKLTVDKLSVDAISELVVDDGCGAISIFVGTTRDNFEGKKVLRLEYEAYEPMALKAMKGICDDVRSKWPVVHDIAVYHRLGAVPCREASVVIAVSSPHRRDSLEAVSFAIDQLKATVPIWKKEVYEDGVPVWKENIESPEKSQQTDVHIDRSLVQITASNEELQQRINKFIEAKRNQVNTSNIHDFIPSAGLEGGAAEEDDAETCARVRSQFVRARDRHGKSHLKIHKVHNDWGPMTAQREELLRLSQPGGAGGAGRGGEGGLPAAIAERTLNIEKFLKVEKVEPDIYRRLKAMEDKVAYLESLSPEYAQFWSKKTESEVKQEYSLDYKFTADDISRRIAELEKQ